MNTLPKIPLIEIGDAGPVALFESAPSRAEEILRLGRLQFGEKFIAMLDIISKYWASYNQNSGYNAEIEEIASQLPRGVWFMNLCLEWACTSGVMADITSPGMRLLRTLDWPFHGVGKHLVVAKQKGSAGEFYNLTWPAFTGVVQAMAPERFALALNQAPMVHYHALPTQVDWIISKLKIFTDRRILPVLLMREVVESCQSYDQALEALSHTPVAIPAIFSLIGTRPGEGAVIERLENRTLVNQAPAAAANHWTSERFGAARPRGIYSCQRYRLMQKCALHQITESEWLTYPVLNNDTRLVMAANPNSGILNVQGYEMNGPATETFHLSH